MSRDEPGVTGAAESGRATQREAVSCRMAPEPADLGITRRLPQPSPKSVTSRKLALARSLHKDPGNTVRDICATLGFARATFYRHLPPRDATPPALGQGH